MFTKYNYFTKFIFFQGCKTMKQRFIFLLMLSFYPSLFSQVIDWSASLEVSTLTTTNNLQIGGSNSGTDGYDNGMDVLAPPPPASGGYYSYLEFSGTHFNRLVTDIRGWDSPCESNINWALNIVNSSGVQSTITWDQSELPKYGTLKIVGPQTVNMRNQSSYSVTGNQELIIQYRPNIVEQTSVTNTGTFTFNELSYNGDGHSLELTFNEITGNGNVQVSQGPTNYLGTTPWNYECGFFITIDIDQSITDYSADIKFYYTDNDIHVIEESKLRLYTSHEGGNWTLVPNQSIDIENNIITAHNVTQFSSFSIAPSGNVENITGSISDLDLTLDWDAVTGAASYKVYRDTIPNFTPDISSGRNLVLSEETLTNWTDSNALGDPETNNYYKISAVSSGGVEGDANITYGEFDVILDTSGTGYNTITYVLNNTNITSVADLGATIPNCTAVKVWNPTQQGYAPKAFKIGEMWIGNDSVKIGNTYYVNVTDSCLFTSIGKFESFSQYSLSVKGTGYNTVALPLNSILSTAAELGASIPNCTAVKQWDPEQQGYVSLAYKIGEMWIGAKAVIPGYTYYINVTKEGIWVPE